MHIRSTSFFCLLLFLNAKPILSYASVNHESLNLFSPNNHQNEFTILEPARTKAKGRLSSTFMLDVGYKSLSLYGDFKNTKSQDLMTFGHFGASYGMAVQTEIGFKAPILLNQKLPAEQTGQSLELSQAGFTSLSGYIKRRFLNSSKSQLSVLIQAGSSLTDTNYFNGDSPGITYSAHLLYERQLNKWKTALNFGYLKRSPGEYDPSRYLFIEPIKGTLQASAGLSRKIFPKTGFSIEALHNINSMERDRSDRDKSSTEMYVSLRRKYKRFMGVVGFGAGLNEGISTPEIRGFAGINFDLNKTIKKPLAKVVVDEKPIEDVDSEVEVEEAPVFEAPAAPITDIALDEPPVIEAINLNYVEFKFNSTALGDKSREVLDKLISYIKNTTYQKIKVIGHADLYGSTFYNEKISLKRAKVIFDYLTANGLDPSKIEYDGYGKRRPLESGLSEEKRRINRRVEIRIERKRD